MEEEVEARLAAHIRQDHIEPVIGPDRLQLGGFNLHPWPAASEISAVGAILASSAAGSGWSWNRMTTTGPVGATAPSTAASTAASLWSSPCKGRAAVRVTANVLHPPGGEGKLLLRHSGKSPHDLAVGRYGTSKAGAGSPRRSYSARRQALLRVAWPVRAVQSF